MLSENSLLKPIFVDPLTNPQRLSNSEITNIIKNYPPLTFEEFRYSQINIRKRAPDEKDPSIMIISPIKSNKHYSLLSAMTHKCYIKHRITQIPNQAPSIAQWFAELQVYPDELNTSVRINKNNYDVVKYCDPKTSFFTEANINFASSQNARQKKERKGYPVYYYYVDPQTNRPMHLNSAEIRQLYCCKYEQTIMFEQSPARPVFEQLWKKLMTRSRDIPILMRGFGIDERLDSSIDIRAKYMNTLEKWNEIHCLVEMLVNFPNIDNCIWHSTQPVYTPYYKPQRKKDMFPRPKVTYTNPHSGKTYEYNEDEDIDDNINDNNNEVIDETIINDNQ